MENVHGNVIEEVGIKVKLEQSLNWSLEVKDTRKHPIYEVSGGKDITLEMMRDLTCE